MLGSLDVAWRTVPAGYRIELHDVHGASLIAVDPDGGKPPLRFHFPKRGRGWVPLKEREIELLKDSQQRVAGHAAGRGKPGQG